MNDEIAINDQVGGEPITVFWTEGTASALDSPQISSGRDIGTAAAFSRQVAGQTLTFGPDNGFIRDVETGSTWDIFGQATDGELEGESLTPVVAVNHFWFSWAAFQPETRVYQP